jgi:hypothetical protein
MKSRRQAVTTLVAGLLLASSGIAFTADAPKKPDATVTIDETQFAVIIGGSVGGGKITYQGKEHAFKINGLAAGANVGVSKMSAAGEVYDLKDLSKFAGTYTKLDASVTAGGGVGALHLKNENGVVMKLTSRTQGLQLNVGTASGVKVTLKD